MLTSATHPQAASLAAWTRKTTPPPEPVPGVPETFQPSTALGALGPLHFTQGQGQGQSSKIWGGGIGASASMLGMSAVGGAAGSMTAGALVGAAAGLGAMGLFAMPAPAAPRPDPAREVRQLATAFDRGHQMIAETDGYMVVGGVRLKRRVATA